MKAITVKYLGATNTKGARMKASDEDGNTVTIGRHYDLDIPADAKRAALALVAKMEWKVPPLVGGSTKDGHVFVMVAGLKTAEESLRGLFRYILTGHHYRTANPYCIPVIT